MGIFGTRRDTAVGNATLRPIGESSRFKSAVEYRGWIARDNRRTGTDDRVAIIIDADKCGKESGAVAVSVGGLLHRAVGPAIAKIPVPREDGIAAGVNGWSIELNRQRRHAVRRTGGELNGRRRNGQVQREHRPETVGTTRLRRPIKRAA